jgi:CheY-like chemotaxis protein
MHGENPLILVVEDDPGIQSFLSMALRDEGYEVKVAGDGKQGLEFLSRRKPMLIILDLMMPVMDGWTFLEHKNQNVDWREIPVLLLSASRDAPQTAQNNNILAFFPKPFDLNALLDYLSTAV